LERVDGLRGGDCLADRLGLTVPNKMCQIRKRYCTQLFPIAVHKTGCTIVLAAQDIKACLCYCHHVHIKAPKGVVYGSAFTHSHKGRSKVAFGDRSRPTGLLLRFVRWIPQWLLEAQQQASPQSSPRGGRYEFGTSGNGAQRTWGVGARIPRSSLSTKFSIYYYT
jgi:hypothetical protein